MSNVPICKIVRKYGIYAVYLFFTLLCAYVCFARLDVALLQHWDEARHGVNAYEMMKNHNYIVNTYNYENDYFNLKPPLSYWGIILGFKLLGVNIFGMRFYSALAMFLTFLIIATYLHKQWGQLACVSSMMMFLTFYDMFYWHAGRNADADAIYILFFTIGCLCLMESLRRPSLIYGCGLMFALCFLSKSWHACVLLPIGGLFWLLSGLFKKLKPRQYLIFFLCAFGPILLWAVARYQYDGMDFLGQMFGVDVTQRISWSESSNSDYGFFLNYMLRSRAVLVMLAAIAFSCAFLLLQKLCGRRSAANAATAGFAADSDSSNPDASQMRAARLTPTALTLILWITVPLLVFSLSHTYYYWYVYPIFPGLCIAASVLIAKCQSSCAAKRRKLLLAAFLLLPALAALHYDRITVNAIDNLEISGFQLDLQAAMEQYPDLHGMDIYVEKNNNEYKDSFYWEQAGLLMAELAGDLKCEEGGVKAFLNAPGSALLIVDPYFYEEYGEALKEFPVLYQNEYILLQKQ